MNDISHELRSRAQDYREPDSIGPLLAEAANELDRLQGIVDTDAEIQPCGHAKHWTAYRNPVDAGSALYCVFCELERLQGIEAALPKDAEGNAVYPGRQLVSTHYGSIQQPRTVVEIWTDGWTLGASTKYRANDPDRPCYGSVEAAEKARGA